MGTKEKQLQRIILRDVIIYFITIIFISSFLDNNSIKFSKTIGWLIMLAPPIILIVSLLNRLKKFHYICNNCNSEIDIKFKNMFTLHTDSQKRLKCKHCNKVGSLELQDK